MQYLQICQQPDNSKFFKGHGSASPVGTNKLNYSEGGKGLAKKGDKAQRWSS